MICSAENVAGKITEATAGFLESFCKIYFASKCFGLFVIFFFSTAVWINLCDEIQSVSLDTDKLIQVSKERKSFKTPHKGSDSGNSCFINPFLCLLFDVTSIVGHLYQLHILPAHHETTDDWIKRSTFYSIIGVSYNHR